MRRPASATTAAASTSNPPMASQAGVGSAHWNLIARNLDVPSFHPEFDRLFAFGIDPDSGDVPRDEPRDWPPVEAVQAYNQRVRETLDALLDRAPAQIVHVAIEHRLMHAETFAYLLHNLPYERKAAITVPPGDSHASPEQRFIEITPGMARLGAAPNQDFGWDNEFEAHEVHVPAFAIGKYKITNGDYLRFVKAGAAPPPFWTYTRHYPIPANWSVQR